MGKEDKLFNEKEYKLLQSFKDERYGEIKVYQNNQTAECVCWIVKVYQNPEDLAKDQKVAEIRKRTPHQNIIRLINYVVTSSSNLCSKTYKLDLLYEYCHNNLYKEINQMNIQQFDSSYSLQSIYEIMLGLINALIHKKTYYYVHDGDIRPYNTLIFPDNTYKITDNFANPQDLKAYQQLLVESRQDANVSPELYNALRTKEQSPSFDGQKDDVYALGVMIIKMALIEQQLGIYDPSNYKVKENIVDDLLERVSQKYGPQLAGILQQMLITDPKHRFNYDQVKELLEIALSQDTEQIQIDQHYTNQNLTDEQFYKNQYAPPTDYQAINNNQSLDQRLKEIDRKVNETLESSRSTVMQYGGTEGIKAYNSATQQQYPIASHYDSTYQQNYSGYYSNQR